MDVNLEISSEDFKRNFFGKKPLLMRGACCTEDFSWHDANGIFARRDVMANDFKLSSDGIIPKSRYVESYWDIGELRHRLIRPAVYDALRDGATLIANKIKNEPIVESLARQIGRFTGCQVVSSAYAAFGTRDSFRAHWDTRDVFAFQLIGRKRWIVYEPSLPDPIYTQQSKDYEQIYPCPEKPCMDFVLEAGDLFYLPRGWWHNPLPLGEPTFHVSLGVFPPLAMDYLAWAVGRAPSFAALRKAIPDWEQGQIPIATMARHIADFLCSPENYHQFRDEHRAAMRLDSPLAIDILGDPSGVNMLDEQRVQISSNNLDDLEKNYVIANGTKVKLDGTGLATIRLIAQMPGISVGKLLERLPGIDPLKLRVLVADLCRQDVLEVVE
ncbi:JmjC domain-containing protein [Achromobacter aegrifaciens]|uniref:JmjC domain-containing protein n=1 Tax=Achromobacter aegrifaciens TaxID=1287736 RepID=UPI0028A75E2C|nr:cupin domain-containing protein [Achromobacter aegrifaciens]